MVVYIVSLAARPISKYVNPITVYRAYGFQKWHHMSPRPNFDQQCCSGDHMTDKQLINAAPLKLHTLPGLVIVQTCYPNDIATEGWQYYGLHRSSTALPAHLYVPMYVK